MKYNAALSFILLFASIAPAAEPLTILGPTTAQDPLPHVPGVRHVEVFHPNPGDWTYNHHVDLAVWKGRLYLAWDSCQMDEDVGVSRELYATSQDGFKWSTPAQLFPQGVSTALRMYFFLAPTGRMLAIAGLRTSSDTIVEASKAGLVVREIRADHSLGEVFTLRPIRVAVGPQPHGPPPLFTNSPDPGFIQSCQKLLQNNPFLEQQDYGRLLDQHRMKWHDLDHWPADEPSRQHFPNRFGKAMCFFHRADGALVSVMKWGWVTVSRDQGQTWSQPTRPPTLVAGMAKTWGQRTSNGKYVLFYNPDLEKRYPLVMVHGDDGITFGNMRIVNGDVPPIRYPGLHKVPGPQYVRGISEWSTDGSWKDDAIWIAYSIGKEDIWVSRVPNP